MTIATSDNVIRELDRRSSDGISVRLLWDSVADEVLVEVHDIRNDESFAVQVAPADALLAFHHPFAYGTAT